MASYIPNLTDSIPDLPMYKPDLGFFSRMVQRRSGMYEQGYNQVKSAYDSILNAPLTNSDNIQTRDTYLKQAQDQLKNLSSVDLSMPQNVDAANNVFAPFWQDDKLLKDASLTKYAQSEMQRGFSLRDSKDPKDREQYSDVAMQYLSNGLDKMKNLSRDDNSAWNNLEKRSFTPFVNKNEVWAKAAKDAGFEVNFSDVTGQFIVNTKNGPMSQQAWKAFAEANTTQQMRDMDRVKGIVENEQSIKNVKKQNPQLSDSEAEQFVAQDYLKDMRQHAQEGLDGVTSEIKNTQAKLDQFKVIKNITPAQKNRIVELSDYLDNLQGSNGSEGLLQQKQKIYNSLKTDQAQGAVDLVNQITSHPEYYFANLSHQRDVNNWAAGQSANYSRKVEYNQAWGEADKVAYEREELLFKKDELAHKIDQDLYDRTHKKDYYRDGDPNTPPGSGTGSGSGTPGIQTEDGRELQHGILLGPGTTDVTKTGTALDALNQRQAFRLGTATNSVFDYDGLGRTLEGLGDGKGNSVTQKDVVNYLSSVKRGETNLSSEEKASAAIINKALELKTGIKVTNQATLRNAILKQGESYFTDKNHNGSPDWSNDDVQSLIKYRDGVAALDEFNSIEKRRQDLITKQLSQTSDPDLKKLITTGPEGTKQVITSQDIQRNLKGTNYILEDDDTGERKTFTPQDLSKLYLQGKLGYKSTSSGYAPVIDGKTYLQTNTQPTSEGRYNSTPGDMFGLRAVYKNSLIDEISDLEKRYGKSSKIAGTLEKLNQAVVPNIGEYNNETGKMGQVFNYPLNSKESKAGLSTGNKLLNEASEAGNREAIYLDGALSKDDGKNKAITSLMALDQDKIKDYISSVHYNQNGLNGKPTLDLVINPDKTSDKTEIAGVAMKDLAGHTIQVQLSDNAQGPTIQSIPKNSGIYIYDALLRGKSIEADPIMKSGNFDYSIQPDDTKNPKQAYVTINNKVFNKNTGKYDDNIAKQVFDLYGPNAKTPDELKHYIDNLFESHLVTNKLNQQLYKQELPPQTSQTYDDVLNELRNRKVGQ